MRLMPTIFHANFHMDSDTFDFLFQKIKPHLIPKRNTRPKDAIEPEHRLALTLE